MLSSDTVRRVMQAWPGKKRFGMYRFLPLFFVLGAALEFSMINWKVGKTNFYSVYKEKQAHKIALQSVETSASTSNKIL